MNNLVQSTFPSAVSLPGCVNSICRDLTRRKDPRHCPFACLSAYSHANAMLLALFSEFINKLRALKRPYEAIVETLRKNADGKGRSIPSEAATAALHTIGDMKNRAPILAVSHPVIDLFMETVNKNSAKLYAPDDIIKAIEAAFKIVASLLGGYDKDNTEISEKYYEGLTAACSPLLLAIESMVKIRTEAWDYILQKMREVYAEPFPACSFPDERKQQEVLEIALRERMVRMVQDGKSVLRSEIDVSAYK